MDKMNTMDKWGTHEWAQMQKVKNEKQTGSSTLEKCRSTAWACNSGVRIVRGQLVLDPVSCKCFCEHISSSGQLRELWGCCSVGQDTWWLGAWKRKRNYLLASLLTSKICFQASQFHKHIRKVCRSIPSPTVDRALKPSAHRQSMRADDASPVVLR